MNYQPPKFTSKISLIILGILILMIFVVPLFIHPFSLSVSPSSDYQFNNIIAVFLTITSLLFASFAYWRFFGKDADFGDIADLFSPVKNNQLKSINLYIAFAIFCIGILFFYLLGATYGFGEGTYFLLRIDRIKIGQHPYRDFEYAYGLILLYFPYLISEVFNISTVQAYYVAYAIFSCLGLYFLFYTINYFNIAAKSKKGLFYAITLACLPYCFGVNFTMFRFLTPIFCLILIHKLLNKKYETSIYRTLVISTSSFLLVLFNLGISIEIAVAVGIAVYAYFYVSAVVEKKADIISIAIVLSLLLIVFSIFFNKNLFLVLKAFSSGGNNFPVIPAPVILFYLITFLVMNSIFASLIIKKKIYFISFTLLIFNVIMLPGAFGRCDPGHIFCYGLGSFICLWAYLSYKNAKLYKTYRISFVVIITIGFTLCNLFMYKAPIANLLTKVILTRPNGEKIIYQVFKTAHFDTTAANLYMDKFKLESNFKKIDSFRSVALPFDVDAPLYLHVLNKKRYTPEYYTGPFTNLFTPTQIEQKLNELKDDKHLHMIIPKSFYDYKPIRDDALEARFISIYFLFPFNYKKKKNSEDLYTPVYSYIRNNYKIIETYNDYYLIERI